MKRKQVIGKLRSWNHQIENKINVLQRASKVYFFIAIVDKLGIAIITAGLLVISSMAITSSLSDPLFITLLVLQIVLAVFNGLEAILSPNRKASDCSNCSKQYQELNREISVTIDDLYETGDEESMIMSEVHDDLSEKYMYLSLLYSSKEQLILQSEPLIFFTKMGKQLVDNEPCNENTINRREKANN